MWLWLFLIKRIFLNQSLDKREIEIFTVKLLVEAVLKQSKCSTITAMILPLMTFLTINPKLQADL